MGAASLRLDKAVKDGDTIAAKTEEDKHRLAMVYGNKMKTK